MLGQMQGAALPRHLQIERQVSVEAMLPVDLEAQEIDVELAGFCLVEDSENWCAGPQSHGASISRLAPSSHGPPDRWASRPEDEPVVGGLPALTAS